MRIAGWCAVLLLAGCANFAERESPSKTTKPNILFIFADDLGYGDLGCTGAPDTKTPNIDRLARQGVQFLNAYSNGAECSPTRTALLSGRWTRRAGGLECAIGTGNVGRYDDAIRLAKAHDLGLPSDISVLGRGLKRAGYSTAVFGKWHMGYEDKFNPLDQGFDQFLGFLGGNVDYFRHVELSPLPVFLRDRKPVTVKGHTTKLITDEAVRFLRAQDGSKPFFLYLSQAAPHTPYQVPGDEHRVMTKENWNDGTRARHAALVEHMDREIGRVLKALRESGLESNTIVVFASDNGGARHARNAPYSGFKSSLFEGGIRVPVIARWPGHIRPRIVSNQATITMDLTASFLAAAGATGSHPLDGIDILDHVVKNRPDFSRALFWTARRGERTERAVRFGNLKYLHRRLDSGEIEEYLFDLVTDPVEKSNLLEARPKETRRLRKRLEQWETETQPTR